MACRRKFIIDTDAGIDDAQAILMALNQEDVEVIAITTCHGNVGVDQVTINVLRVLRVANRTEIPVYRGCNKALLGTNGDASFYHGVDGLGDSPDSFPPEVSAVKPEHAVLKLIELTCEHQDVSLVCLAPLTNIAMAIRMDPKFSERLTECFIMGGSYEGKGNVSATAEYNFHTDPEAADIVLREMICPVTLVCWELCLKYSFSWEWYNTFVDGKDKKQKFMKRIEKKITAKMHDMQYITADQAIMAVAIDKNIAKTNEVACLVESGGINTRGQLCVDWQGWHFQHKKKIKIVTELDREKYSDLLMGALRSKSCFVT